jgi:hypothetical protein
VPAGATAAAAAEYYLLSVRVAPMEPCGSNPAGGMEKVGVGGIAIKHHCNTSVKMPLPMAVLGRKRK